MNFPPPCDKNDPKSRCNRTKKIWKQISKVFGIWLIVGIGSLEANRYIQKNKLRKWTFLENSYLEYKKDWSKIQDIVTSNNNIDDSDTTKITHSLREELHENMISDFMIDEFISRYADVITSEEALKSQDFIGSAKERGLDDLMYANLQPSKASISPTQINKKDIDIPWEFFSLMQSQQPENFKLFVHSVSQRKIKTPTWYEQLYKILWYDDTQKCESDIKNGKIALSENQWEYSRAFSAIYLKYLLNQEYNKFLEQWKSGEYEPKDVQKMYNDYYIKYRKVLDKHNKDLTGMANSQWLYPKIIDNIEHPYTQACEVYNEGKNICDQIISWFENHTYKKITALLDQLEQEWHIHIPIKIIKQKIEAPSKPKKIVKWKVQKSKTVLKKVKDYSNKGVLVQVKTM